MQLTSILPIGTDGIFIWPESRYKENSKVLAALTFPTLNAGIHTVASSADGGTTWVTESGPLALTGKEVVNPTPDGNTGAFRVIYGPYPPGSKIRVTSSVAQAEVVRVQFME